MRIGVISDTHGLLRESALSALKGSAHILHAGDIGKPAVLEALRALAPLSAVRGNNDTEPWARSLPEQARLQFARVTILLLHDVNTLAPGLPEGHVRVIVSGHSHQPRITELRGVLYLNPGSAGPRRFRLPVSVAELTLTGARVRARLIELPP